MPKRFCYICGKITNNLVEGKCFDCFIKEKEILRVPNKIEVKICGNCLRYYEKGNWKYIGNELGEVLESASIVSLQNSITILDLKDPEQIISVEKIKQKSKNRYEVSLLLRVKGCIEGETFEDSKNIEVNVITELCKDCSRMHGGYYEAILQIRNEIPIGILEEVEEITDAYAKKESKAFITKVKKLKKGIDIYFGSSKVAKKIAKILKKKYEGELKISPTLSGIDKNGKKIYRITISLRLEKK